jgi:hypothetical protein
MLNTLLLESQPSEASLVSSYMKLSPSEPKVSICNVDGKIPLLIHTPLPTPLGYLRDTFQSPTYVMMVDAIKAASRCSDYVVTSQSKELITLFLSYMQC